MASGKKSSNEDRVHELRVSVKRHRALVRLLKLINPRGTARLNRELRNLGRFLSKFRDDSVRAHWLQKHGFKANSTPVIAASSIQKIESRISSIREKLNSKAELLLVNSTALNRAVNAGFQKMKKSKEKAVDHKRDEDFHEWRKRTKDLLYQLEYLGVNQYQRPLRKIGHQLGLAHDCTLAEQFIKAHPRNYKKNVFKCVAREKRELQEKALRIGGTKQRTLRLAERLTKKPAAVVKSWPG